MTFREGKVSGEKREMHGIWILSCDLGFHQDLWSLALYKHLPLCAFF